MQLTTGRRVDHRHRPGAAEEPRDVIHRAHCGGQPDALGGLGQQGVKPLQAQCQMRAAFAACHGVYFIDNYRLYAA